MSPPGRRDPPTAPPGLWQRPEMVRALADRDMGAVVKMFRRWTGASQTDVSVLVGMPQSHVSDLERGVRRVTSLDLFERFADGLGIPRGLLGLAERDSGPPPGDPVADSQRRWRQTRHFLGTHRTELTRLASRLYPESDRLDDTGLLSPPTWRLAEPVDLAAVRLVWRRTTALPAITGGEREALRLRPLTRRGREYSRYHRAVRDLARPGLFENRLCYRLLDARTGRPHGAGGYALRLTLGEMTYFDMIDVGEALAHEIALTAADERGRLVPERVCWERLPFRRLVAQPAALDRYPLMISVSTLTVRRGRSGATFFLLRRDPAKVAIAGGMLSVFPTGVFQPASVLRAPDSPDFDLWRNIMREYSEEYLGNPEHDGGGPPINYAEEEPFRSLDRARADGGVTVYCLGLGIDALNYVGDLLTVAVFDDRTFDTVFREMVDRNDEGDVAEEFAFDKPTVRHLLRSVPMAPSGAACLRLAWQHRARLFRP